MKQEIVQGNHKAYKGAAGDRKMQVTGRQEETWDTK